MDNAVDLVCQHCGATNRLCVSEKGDETATVECSRCGRAVATVGQLHARVAQEAIGLGATDLRDDHVPVSGEFGERPGV